MAIYIGKERAGWRGLIVAGPSFILPAVLITRCFAWLCKEYGQLPEFQPFLYGIQPALIVLILMAIFPLAKKSLKTVSLWILAVITLVLALFNFNQIYLLFGAGIFAVLIVIIKNNNLNSFALLPLFFSKIPRTTVATLTNLNLFLVFLKIGAILYGSGYVLFAFLDAELVSRGILSRTTLIYAIAVGQFTPGPVFSAVTFIGYQMNGITGAVVASLGIFLPSFIFVALLHPFVKKNQEFDPFFSISRCGECGIYSFNYCYLLSDGCYYYDGLANNYNSGN